MILIGNFNSGQKLCEENKKIETFEVLPKGDKLEDPDDQQLEERKIGEKNLKNLYELLKLERVTLGNSRSRGIYEMKDNRVKITKTLGKWTGFGYSEEGDIFLHAHEALLFMEMVNKS